MDKFLLSCCKLILTTILTGSLFNEATAQSGVVDIGKSFANISKLTNGGTFEPNDIIEIRVTFAVRNVAPSQITNVQVFDTVPAKTTYIPNSIRVTTNEGITYKGPFTDASDTDQGSSVSGNILINVGTGATGTTGGSIRNTDRPSFFTSSCIIVACFRVSINASANYGDTIKIGGKTTYSISGVPQTVFFPLFRIILTPHDLSPCSNGLYISAASDSMGTFASGIIQNRAAPLSFTTTYTKQNLTTGTPQDYNYAIVNNSSGNGSTNPNVSLPNAASRVFGLWDISGDHTGAANPALGNPPAAPGTRGGYMVVINSSYNTDTAYRETLYNLCPNTYYEFSAWFRNICPRCSSDSTGKGSGTAGFLPGPGNDSAGVKPNINFNIDGLSYYTSGDIRYDRTTPWKKYGFTFLTKPGQTTANFLIRNNSPGGGGNDWVMDDINISHCGPSLVMNYNPFVLGCSASPFVVNLSDTVRYLYNNSYVHFQWQVSNVGGTVWNNLTGPGTSGVGAPTLVNGQYQYVTNLPAFLATPADSGKYFRLIVATTAANLIGNCAYTDGNTTMIKVINCGQVLLTDFVRFKGDAESGKSILRWTVQNETELDKYEIERSTDGQVYSFSGYVNAKNINSSDYYFTDPQLLDGTVYYRIKMIYRNSLYKYSTVVMLGSRIYFSVKNLINPVKNNISAEVIVPHDGMLNLNLFNINGKKLKSMMLQVSKGSNYINMENPGLPSSVYYLSLDYNNESIKRKIILLK